MKADLQIHSPRDRGWQGSRPEDILQLLTPNDVLSVRQKWANDFIDVCIKEHINVVAITDHHEGIYLWVVIDELKKRKQVLQHPIELWIMPGMEITTKDSAQAIIIFDSDLPKQLFEKTRSHLRLPTNCSDLEPKGIEVELLDYNLEQLQDVLEKDVELKGKFIIFPNVTPQGHKTVLRRGFHKRFKDMPYVGGYMDKKYPNDLDEGDRKILNGEIPAWTSKRLGIITTSDSRSSDFVNIGKSCTWIKLTAPKAESLRQAMLAADSRILYNSPQNPELFIENITVIGSEFMSLSEPIHFSHQFSAVIGGRGSGKSTLLEFIRFAIGRSAFDINSSAWDPTYERRKSILINASSKQNGSVEIVIKKDGALITLRRSFSSDDRIEMQVQSERKFITPEDARKLFKIQAYSQGELSLLGDEKAEKRLFDLIVEPYREDFDKAEKTLLNLTSQIRECLEQT